MSIPIDRLYHFLDGICNRDIIIYRFFPHGSKKHINLQPLYNYAPEFPEKSSPECFAISYTNIRPSIIFHDQEPLDWEAFTIQEFLDEYPIPLDVKNLLIQANMREKFPYFIDAYNYSILCHSEKNSTNLSRYEEDGFIGVYYWAHALIARDWFRYAEHDPALHNVNKNITYDFLIYNRAWSGSREYRLAFAALLADAGLIHRCNIKFSEFDNNTRYTDHQFRNPALTINRKDLHTVYSANNTPAVASADYDNIDYATSGIEVVLETLFDDCRLHLTEKTLRPIACGKPFMLAATPGSLQYLRDYGFETFDGLIDESYDTILDPVQRLQAIVNELARISRLAPSEKTQLWESCNKIADKNKQLFFSKEWHDNIVHEFKINMDQGFNKLIAGGAGRNWKKFTETHGMPPPWVTPTDLEIIQNWTMANSKIL